MSQKLNKHTCLPNKVINKVKERFLNFQGTPFSFIQTSHRSQMYNKLNMQTIDTLKKFFRVQHSHQVLMLPSGTAIPSLYFNILGDQKKCSYKAVVVKEGLNSQQIYDELSKMHAQTIFTNLQDLDLVFQQLKQDQKMLLIYSRIEQKGKIIKLPQIPQNLRDRILLTANYNYQITPLVEQPQQNIIFVDSEAGLSIPGFNIILIESQLLHSIQPIPTCPDMMDYPQTFQKKSVVNTPFTLCTLVLQENLNFIIENCQKIEQKIRENKQKFREYLREFKIQFTETNDQISQFVPLLVIERNSLDCQWKNIETLKKFANISTNYITFFFQLNNDEIDKFVPDILSSN